MRLIRLTIGCLYLGCLRTLQTFINCHRRWLFAMRSVGLVSVMGIVAIAYLIGGYIPSAYAENYDKELLIDSDFSNQDLTDSSFTKANLRNSNLSGANLVGVSFFGANLEGADLTAADLRYATLDTARFVGANLTNAVLEGAFAFNTKFDGATIQGADFTDVLLRGDMQDKLCQIADGANPTTGRSTRDSLLCD